MAKRKPLNAGIQFERDFIKTAIAAGFEAEKLSTPTPPMRPCTCGATPRSSFTTKRPYDVFLTWSMYDLEGRKPNQGPSGHYVIAVECKSSGKEPRLTLDRIEPHQIKGLRARAAAGWQAGLAIDLPKPAAEGEREWWWLAAEHIEQLQAICVEAGRKSATWKELKAAGATQIPQSVSLFGSPFRVY